MVVEASLVPESQLQFQGCLIFGSKRRRTGPLNEYCLCKSQSVTCCKATSSFLGLSLGNVEPEAVLTKMLPFKKSHDLPEEQVAVSFSRLVTLWLLVTTLYPSAVVHSPNNFSKKTRVVINPKTLKPA